MSSLLSNVKQLEQLTVAQRKKWMFETLNRISSGPVWQRYETGQNLIVPPQKLPFVAVSGHVDVVSNSPGANDNASSLAVIIELAARFRLHPLQHIGVSFLVFDEEETGLKGSQAYLEAFGTDNLIGLINQELVGMGEHVALWPLGPNSEGHIWEVFEQVAASNGVMSQRFDSLILNTADHESFYGVGFEEAFTLTRFSNKDMEVAQHYYKAMTFGVSQQTLWEIISEAPLFKHYHKPTDRSEHLDEKSLLQTAELIEETLRQMDRNWEG